MTDGSAAIGPDREITSDTVHTDASGAVGGNPHVLLHALASVLLVLLLRRSGVSDAAALLGGAFFLVHPANVEAVAWISQLKTSSALVLTLLALLALERRPALSSFAFGLGLLAKPIAASSEFSAWFSGS